MLESKVFAVAVQLEPLCVTAIVLPAIVSVVERAEKLFGPAKIVIAAGPDPLALVETVSQGAVAAAVQLQLAGNVRLTLRRPPLESKASEGGLMTGSWQEPAS